MSENETVNQSQSAAGGSGEKPEKLVADHVEKSWEYITENGFDLLADVAVDTLVKNGAVPSDAYLHSVKTSWCLHRAAVHYARQYSVERVSADFARGDAQFEHSLRAQAERKAEKLEADLAQSVLLVENLRLRIDEARTKETESPAAKWCRKIRELQNSLQQRQQELSSAFASNEELRQSLRSHKMKLETAEAALLEQQQRNEELVTQNSHQFTKIAELQRQVEGAKTQELEGQTQELPEKTQELPEKTQELPEKTQELPAEYTPPDGWRLLEVGEPLQNGDQWITESGAVEVLREVKTEIVQPNGHYIRQIQPEVVLLKECNARQAELIADLKYERSGAMESREVLSREKRKLTEQIEELRSEVSYVQRLLGESNRKVAQLEDLVGSLRTINEAQEKAFEAAGQHNSDLQSRLNAVCAEWSQQAETIRRLQIELAGAIQSRDLLAETNREQAGKIEHLQRQVEGLQLKLQAIREAVKAARRFEAEPEEDSIRYEEYELGSLTDATILDRIDDILRG